MEEKTRRAIGKAIKKVTERAIRDFRAGINRLRIRGLLFILLLYKEIALKSFNEVLNRAIKTQFF